MGTGQHATEKKGKLSMSERQAILGFHLTPLDFLRAKRFERRSAKQRPPGRRAFVFGHLPGGDRFPEENVDKVREGLWKKLDMLDAAEQITELVTCSGAAGADSLAFEWAFQKLEDNPTRKITLMMYLPFKKGSFIEHSVLVSSKELNKRWLHNFKKAAKMGVVYRPHLKDQPKLKMVLHKPEIQLPRKGRKGKLDLRFFRLPNFAPGYEEVRAESARRNNGDKYQHYIDVNTNMLGLLRPPAPSADPMENFNGDVLVAVWDGKDAAQKDPLTGKPKAGGTYDILYQAKEMGIPNENIYITQEGLGNIDATPLAEFDQ